MDIDAEFKIIKFRIVASIVVTCISLFVYLVFWDGIIMSFIVGMTLGFTFKSCTVGGQVLKLKEKENKKDDDKTDKSV